uniref:Uncharacterized protein n=1 Tax=Compsopogon caeruleus TaxID=31354 RepID=A0A7S1TE01_9RHOD|mmetsp:Transcript_1993/g.3566  ORF Transcript_1993/g.3566 Transcript_1993/m.3566 type:complete len:181 (+) Transcript_1993:538-1080(+)|eukprot:CAMPEP_0184690190 /NCGR_PEP_ID=MMETSP0312-20130426/31083_1 /TAXON_ID=31354 /ORGANISM="Compsopogon coeruleus, Strain SAG 36.94" /LENGTH=180 /DNA_ID=CAMNT_0027147645 /DNA_START=307 /DNA_END=849 /DNA_ORIENTATION=+
MDRQDWVGIGQGGGEDFRRFRMDYDHEDGDGMSGFSDVTYPSLEEGEESDWMDEMGDGDESEVGLCLDCLEGSDVDEDEDSDEEEKGCGDGEVCERCALQDDAWRSGCQDRWAQLAWKAVEVTEVVLSHPHIASILQSAQDAMDSSEQGKAAFLYAVGVDPSVVHNSFEPIAGSFSARGR